MFVLRVSCGSKVNFCVCSIVPRSSVRVTVSFFGCLLSVRYLRCFRVVVALGFLNVGVSYISLLVVIMDKVGVVGLLGVVVWFFVVFGLFFWSR